jgi:hypothetical protein
MFSFIRRPSHRAPEFNPNDGTAHLRQLSLDRLNALYAKAHRCGWPNVMRLVKAELERRSV